MGLLRQSQLVVITSVNGHKRFRAMAKAKRCWSNEGQEALGDFATGSDQPCCPCRDVDPGCLVDPMSR